MAFTVQDDSGSVADANAYVTATEFKSYHADRGNDYSTYGTGDIQKAIVRATDFLDHRFNFVGDAVSETQRTQWPRLSAVDSDGNTRIGVPQEVKDACCEYAFIALGTTLDPTPERDDTGRSVSAKSSKVGPIAESVTYAGIASYESPEYPVADRKLSALVEPTGWAMRG